MSPILITLAVLYGFFAWKYPRYAVLTFPLLLPSYLLRAKLGPLPTTLLELGLLSLFIAVTVQTGKTRWLAGIESLKPWRYALLLWTLATAVAVVVAPDKISALGLWRAYILEPIVYLILLKGFLIDESDRWLVIESFIVTTVFIALWSVFQFTTNIGIPPPWNVGLALRRATGPFPFPNAVALYCAPLAALFFGLATFTEVRSTKYARHLLWLGFLSASLATLLAKSVGGSLAIFSCVTLTLLWNKKTRLPIIGAIILGAAILFSVPQLREPTIKTLSFQNWSGRVRVWMWQETADMLKDRPIFGAGLGAYPTVFAPYHKKTFIEIFQYPHNILLNLWSETGLPGILAFIWIIVTWIITALRNEVRSTRYKPSIVYLLPLIALLIHGLVDVPYFKNDLAFQFWILAGLASLPVVKPKTPIER
ncbi:MAG: O-antigen ligase family protein [Patescibacteria group bacterium]|nr:O-antigen ligase family protein [Patescibacteria group bacterium]